MDRRILVKLFRDNGWKLKRHGSKHDVYYKGSREEMLPRHKVIDMKLAKAIIKRCGLK